MAQGKFYLQHVIATVVMALLFVYLLSRTEIPWWLSLFWIFVLWILVISLMGGRQQFQENSMLREEAEILLEVDGILETLPGYAKNYRNKSVQESLLDICQKAKKIADRLGSDTLASLREADSLLRLMIKLEEAVTGYAQIKVSDHSLKQQLLADGEDLVLTYSQAFDEVVDQLNNQDVMAYRHALKSAMAHLGVSGYISQEELSKEENTTGNDW